MSAGVAIRGLCKRYGDTVALDGLDLAAEPGTILGIAGPNGSGKSTMIKILASEATPDDGEITIDGEQWTAELGASRVAVVHQEPQLFPNLTIAENVVIGREHSRWLRTGANDAERALLADFGILEVADRRLGELGLAIQQRTEIVRALAQDARVMLFDEPNSALTEDESDDLFRRMHALADAGRTVMLVSHRLSELAAHSDRVAVIVDGRCAGTLEGAELTPDAIARLLVVGVLAKERAPKSAAALDAPPVLRLGRLSHRAGAFTDIDLTVGTGSIVALAGVEGSGGRELVRAIAGLERVNGVIEIDGKSGFADVAGATAYVSADRADSLFSNLSVGDNGVVRLDDEITGPLLALHRSRMRSIAHELRDRFQVKTASLETPIRALSGGNQQKVAIAAAVIEEPTVLVLEEPTRGVDVGSKAEIYHILHEFAAQRRAVVLFCTEIPEVFEVADLLYVVSDGRLSEPLLVADYPDVEALASAATRLERHAWERSTEEGAA